MAKGYECYVSLDGCNLKLHVTVESEGQVLDETVYVDLYEKIIADIQESIEISVRKYNFDFNTPIGSKLGLSKNLLEALALKVQQRALVGMTWSSYINMLENTYYFHVKLDPSLRPLTPGEQLNKLLSEVFPSKDNVVQVDIPPYPEGIVNGPCICGSWPCGTCLRCPHSTLKLPDKYLKRSR